MQFPFQFPLKCFKYTKNIPYILWFSYHGVIEVITWSDILPVFQIKTFWSKDPNIKERFQSQVLFIWNSVQVNSIVHVSCIIGTEQMWHFFASNDYLTCNFCINFPLNASNIQRTYHTSYDFLIMELLRSWLGVISCKYS